MSNVHAGAVFLSYASQDAEAAKRICDALRAAGVEVWFDQSELRGGDAWDQKIRRQIKECTLFMPIISASTQARHEGYFRLEWHLAEQRSHLIARGRAFIVPVSVDQTNDANALVPDAFLAVQWMRVPGGEASPAFCERVGGLLGNEPGAGSKESEVNSLEAGRPRPALRDERVVPARKALSPTRLALGFLAILVAGAVLYLIFKPRRSPEEIARIIAAAQALGETAAAKSAAEAKPASSPPVGSRVVSAPNEASSSPVVASPVVGDKSVAVLPFTNLSDDKENEYFSDGISEELLTVLQKIPGLHVAARTSAFSFKGRNATVQEIGATLHVANLVEGSVRKAGNSVRISARLTRAGTGEQLWADSFTRDLKDVFAVQSELAQTIVEQLRSQLGGANDAAAKAVLAAQVQAAAKGGTGNAEAHQLYLQGRYLTNQFSEENLDRALACFQRATELDPAFALAWAALSRTSSLRGEYSGTRQETIDAFALSRKAAERAVTLEPGMMEGYLARAEIQMAFDFDWKGADASLRQALALAPADATVLAGAGRLASTFGQMDRCLELTRQAVALDPVNAEFLEYLAFAHYSLGHWREAEAGFRRVIELSPTAPWSYAGLGLTFATEGRFDEALAAARKETTYWSRLTIVAIALWGQKKIPEANAALDELIKAGADVAAYQVADVYAARGDLDQAFAWLDRAHRQQDAGLGGLRADRFLTGLHDDPRWPALLRAMGLADDQLK